MLLAFHWVYMTKLEVTKSCG
ncbi:hypothetical protein EMIT0194P_110107 [Pseudomonas serbica]